MRTLKYHTYTWLSMAILVATLVSACAAPPPPSAPATEKLVFQDDFKDPKSGWKVVAADGTMGGRYNDGVFEVWTNDRRQIVVQNPKIGPQGNFSAEAEVKRTSPVPGSLLGIMYRFADNGDYYRFTITDNQTWVVGRKSKNLALEEMLMEVQSSDLIRPGNETNLLKVICRGDSHELYVNGNKLGSITDNTSLRGDIGLMFSNWTTGAAYTFTNVKVYALP